MTDFYSHNCNRNKNFSLIWHCVERVVARTTACSGF
jgi:hypothetical protein